MVDSDVFAALVGAAPKVPTCPSPHIFLCLCPPPRPARWSGQWNTYEMLNWIAQRTPPSCSPRAGMLAAPEKESGGALRWSIHQAQRLPAIEAMDKDRCQQVLTKLRSTIQVPTARLNGLLPLVDPHDRADWQEAKARLPATVPEEWLNLPSGLNLILQTGTRAMPNGHCI